MQPVISRAYPSDHKIPEAFQRQLAAQQSPVSPSPDAGITLSSPSIGSAPIQDEGLTHGAALQDVIGSVASLAKISNCG